jgi:hypothetical protein
MSEQSPGKALNEEPEVEGHRAALTEDPSVLAKDKAKALDELEGPEVEGHVKTRAPEDLPRQA